MDAAWPDEDGHPLGAAFAKDFTAVKADEEPVDPAKWKVEQVIPTLLSVNFEKPLDAALAARMIRFVTLDGKEVGKYSFSFGDSWNLSLPEALPRGEYLIRVDSRLEDHCGNRVGRAFEFDARKPADDIPAFVDIPFTVK